VIDLDEGISLNIRRTPDVNGEVIANVPSGEQMEIFSRDLSNQWLEVEFDGVRGWVFVQYVSISFNQTSADIESIPFNSDQLAGVAGNTPTPTFTPSETPTSTPAQ
jgi:uncharacterized protein YraI